MLDSRASRHDQVAVLVSDDIAVDGEKYVVEVRDTIGACWAGRPGDGSCGQAAKEVLERILVGAREVGQRVAGVNDLLDTAVGLIQLSLEPIIALNHLILPRAQLALVEVKVNSVRKVTVEGRLWAGSLH
jgi:hypothetical protein